MAGGLSISVRGRGLDRIERRMRALPGAIQRERRRTMEVAVRLVEADLKTNALRGEKGSDPFWGVTGASGNSVGVRSGSLIRSIRARVYAAMGALVGTVGSPLPYAKLHEEGGTVQGKPWLLIPTALLQRAGSGTSVLAGRSARTLPNTTVIRSKTGNLWIAEVGTARSRLASELLGHPILLALLRHSVKHRARRPFWATLQRTLPRVRWLFAGVARASVRSVFP